MNIAKRLTLVSWVLACIFAGHVCKAEEEATTIKTVTKTVETVITTETEKTRVQEQKLMKIYIPDFTTIDIEGQKRFLDFNNKPIVIPAQDTLNDADHKTINPVMQGFVRMIDAWDNTRTNTANRVAQGEDNDFAREKALDVYRKTVQGEARPVVLGANDLSTLLARYSSVFAILDKTQVEPEMEKISREPDFPKDFMLKLSQRTGLTHLIKGTVADIRMRENGGVANEYGVEQRTIDYELDVNIIVMDLAAQHSVFSGSYTGFYRERRPHTNSKLSKNIYNDLMKSALQKASMELYERFRPRAGQESEADDDDIIVKPRPANKAWLGPAQAEEEAAPRTVGKPQVGIARPVSNVLNDGQIKVLWGLLESVEIENYNVITRSALKQILNEIDFTGMDLMNLNTAQKAKLGMIEGLKYILVSEVGTIDGEQIKCTMRLIESSTGEVVPNRRVIVSANSLKELGDVIEDYVLKLFEDDKQLHRTALMAPIIKEPNAPANFAGDFTATLENYMLEEGFKIQNLKSVKKILERNNLDSLAELEPKMYKKVGKLLEVEMLLKPTITKFELLAEPFVVKETGRQGVNYYGAVDGYVRIISVQTGEVIANIPLTLKIDFRALKQQPEMYQNMRSWNVADYHKYMLQMAIAQLIPQLHKYLPRVEVKAE